MGRYLDLARQALADLKDGPMNLPAIPESPQSDNELGYERNESNEKRVSPTPWTDPVVAAARAEAERLGVLGKSAYELNTGQWPARWVTGPSLDTLFERRDAAYVVQKLNNPTFDNPTSVMPFFGLTEAQRQAIADHLKSIIQ